MITAIKRKKARTKHPSCSVVGKNPGGLSIVIVTVVAGAEVGCGLVGTGRPRESGKEEMCILKLFHTGLL